MAVNIYAASAHVRDFAKKVGHEMDVVADILGAAWDMDQSQKDERRCADDEKERIRKAVAELDGQLTPDLEVADILARGNIRNSQGTRAYAKREKKIALLAHAKKS